MFGIREPAVSGTFYPGEASELRRMVCEYLVETIPDQALPKALISPHAGYVYSGEVAGRCISCLKSGRGRIRRILLLGPAHRVSLDGFAASSAAFFRTPLGDIPLDQDAIRSVLSLPGACLDDDAHLLEHSLEVQLPFLQEALGSFSLLPFVVGHALPEEVCSLLDLLGNPEDTVIVVSSDLSHYLEYERAKRVDQQTAKLVESLDHRNFAPERACGAYPVRGLLLFAEQRGLRAKTICLANSGDTAGSKDRVVGYGAWAFYE